MNNKLNNRLNNGLNTDNNINKENNIYLFIINKYKKNFPKNYAEKIKIIGELKNSKEYQQLSLEEQDKLFLELMNYKGE